MSDIETNLEKIIHAVKGEEVRQSIHDAIENCYEDGKAGAVDMLARQQLAGKAGKEELEVQKQRINSIVELEEGSTTGDAELADIRIGDDGTTYQTAGEAVRSQFSDVKNYFKGASIVPTLRNGSIGNSGNSYAVTSTNVIKLNHKTTGIVVEYIGEADENDTFAFGFCLMKNATDNMTTTAAVLDSSVTKYYINTNNPSTVSGSYYLPNSSYSSYDHFSIQLFKYTSGTQTPVRVETEPNCLRVKYSDLPTAITDLALREKTVVNVGVGNISSAIYLEEGDASNTNLYFKVTSGSLQFFNANGQQVKNMSSIVSDLGASTTTSTKGVTGCLQIPNNNALVFDCSEKKMKYVDRQSVTEAQVVLFFNAYGRAENLHPTLLEAKIFGLNKKVDQLEDSIEGLRSETFINVKEYGAVGDGVTDDTQAIQEALEFVKDTGGTVFVPAGTYLLATALFDPSSTGVSSCLHVYSNTTLWLDSGAVLKRGTGINHMVFTHNESSATGYTGCENITIKGGVFDENSELNTDDTALNISHGNNILIENVIFKNASGSWHYIEVNSSKNVRIVGCQFLTGTNAEDIQIDAAIGQGNLGQSDNTVCKNIEIESCYFNTGAHPAIGNHSDAAHQDIRIHDCVIENASNSRGAIAWVASTKYVDVYDCTFTSNVYAMSFGSSQTNSVLRDCRLTGVTTVVNNCIAHNNVIDGVYTP